MGWGSRSRIGRARRPSRTGGATRSIAWRRAGGWRRGTPTSSRAWRRSSGRGRSNDPLLRRVHVEAAVADEAEEREVELGGELDGERGGRADGGDDGHARDDRFLNDLERRAAADEEQVLVQRDAFAEKRADHFVDGVVTADVFAHAQQRAVGRKHACGVNRAGGVEGALPGAERIAERMNGVAGDA